MVLQHHNVTPPNSIISVEVGHVTQPGERAFFIYLSGPPAV